MSFQRPSTVSCLLPVGTLIIAAAGHFVPMPAEGASIAMVAPILAAAIALVCWTVFVVLRHAETVAEYFGEPAGTLILTLSVTVIEASVIVSMMLEGANNPTLARESVFSTVMIVTTGVVGICLFSGGVRHRSQDVRRQGTNALLAVLIALSVLTLVLPNHTLSTGPGTFSTLQLEFVMVLSVLLYSAFLFAQTVSQHDDFVEDLSEEPKKHRPGRKETALGIALLVVGLAGIVLLAEQVATGLEEQLMAYRVPQSDAIIGAFIATLVLLPESVAAIRASLRNELQRAMNIALGSACATIGLTIPVVGAASILSGREITLGLNGGDTTLLLLALVISIISFGTGRTTGLTGLVHLVIFVAYIMLIVAP